MGSALAGHAYAALALPASLAGVVAAPWGAGATVARWQRGLARRLLRPGAGPIAVADPTQRGLARRLLRPDAEPIAVAVDDPAPQRRGDTAGRVLRHSLASLPVNLVAFALVVPMWAVFVARGVLYPVFGAGNLEHSWGGPTLAGAWVVHFVQGPPLLLLVTLLLRPLTRLQSHLVGRFLPDDGDR